MKPARRVRLVRFVLVGTATIALGMPVRAGVNRWTTNGPYGGWISAVAIDPKNPTTLYAGAILGGIYKSVDAAATWTLLAPEAVGELVIDPVNSSTVYAVGFDSDVFKSTDAGATWQSLGLGRTYALAIDPRSPATIYVYSDDGVHKSLDGGRTWPLLSGPPPTFGGNAKDLAMDPAHPDVLWAFGFDRAVDNLVRVYRSTDGGASWSVTGSLNEAYVFHIAVDVASSRAFVSTNQGVFRSADGGMTWQNVLPGSIDGIAALRASEIYAEGTGTQSSGVFQSLDGGDHWTSLSAAGGFNAVAGSPLEPETIYFGESAIGVAKSTDGGTSWSVVSQGIEALASVSIAMNPAEPSDVYATTEAGLFHSPDGGGHWSLVTGSAAHGVVVDSGSLDLLSSAGRSTDAGLTWEAPSPPADIQLVVTDSPRTMFAAPLSCSITGPSAQIFKSVDGGATWALVLEDGIGCVSLLASASGRDVYARFDHLPFSLAFYASHDGGATWATFSGMPDDVIADAMSLLAVDPTNGNRIYGSYAGKLWVSAVGGGEWQDISSGLPLGLVSSLVFDPVSPTTLYGATSGGVYRSLDHGGTWSPFNGGLPDGPAGSLVIDATGRILHVAAGGGVYDIAIGGGCGATSGAVCILGGRFLVTAQAIDPRTIHLEVGTALSQTDEWGYFSLPGFTGDPTFPEIVVKMSDARSIGDGFWFFHSGLTDLQYTLSVLDTATGQQKSYQNDRSDPQALCGGADTGTFTGAASPAGIRAAVRAGASAPGSALTLLGRFTATLSAIDPRTGNEADGVPIARDSKWGFYSLPAFTGDTTFPEVFVKMVDGRSLGGAFWVFHTGLTDLEYTLTVTDSTTGAQRVYRNERSDPSRLCGGSDTDAFRD